MTPWHGLSPCAWPAIRGVPSRRSWPTWGSPSCFPSERKLAPTAAAAIAVCRGLDAARGRAGRIGRGACRGLAALARGLDERCRYRRRTGEVRMGMRVNKDWLLTPQRAALHLPTATAVIADLHL